MLSGTCEGDSLLVVTEFCICARISVWTWSRFARRNGIIASLALVCLALKNIYIYINNDNITAAAGSQIFAPDGDERRNMILSGQQHVVPRARF